MTVRKSSTDAAVRDAKDTALHYLDEIVQQIIDENGPGYEVSRDLFNDYPAGDEYHHLTHVDREYYLTEAAEILDTYREHEETDSGLWEGLEPRQAIIAQAAFTYGNAVMYYWNQVIDAINKSNPVLDDALTDLAAEVEGVSIETIREMVREIIEEF